MWLYRNILSYFLCFVLQPKGKKKANEPEVYEPPVLVLEHEDSVFFSEAFASEDEFESR